MDPPNDCNSLAIGTDPSSTKLDAKELASGMHSSGTEPYDGEGGGRLPPPHDGDSLLNDGKCCPFSPDD